MTIAATFAENGALNHRTRLRSRNCWHKFRRYAPRSARVRKGRRGLTLFPGTSLKNWPEQGIDCQSKEARYGPQSIRTGWLTLGLPPGEH